MTARPRRLLILSPSRSTQGGVESIIADLCRGLPEHGWEVVLGLGKGLRFDDPVAYRKAWPDLPIVEVDGTKGTRQARLEAISKTVRQFEPDVVLLARVFDGYEAVARLKSEYSRLRLAVTVQCYEAPYLLDVALYREQVDLCVTSGELLRSAVVELCGLPGDRTVSIPGGVLPPHVRREERASPEEPLRLGYVGRLEQGQKRVRDLAPFAAELERLGVPFRLVIAGAGPETERVRTELQGLLGSERFTFLGWCDRERLYEEVYPRLDVALHFAEREGVTIAPREAMANGVVPVVSQFVGQATEGQFRDGETALTFPVGDVTAAALAVKQLYDEPDLLVALSEAARGSQQGPYGHRGALLAWADAFDRCVEGAAQSGAIPEVPNEPSGRLDRWLGSPSLAQRARDLVGLRFEHTSSGAEWPAVGGHGVRLTEQRLEQFALEREVAARSLPAGA